ncbi:hypothetical protein ES708_26740 [subsurface metagenome]
MHNLCLYIVCQEQYPDKSLKGGLAFIESVTVLNGITGYITPGDPGTVLGIQYKGKDYANYFGEKVILRGERKNKDEEVVSWITAWVGLRIGVCTGEKRKTQTIRSRK